MIANLTSTRNRRFLLAAGLLLAACGLLAIGYALWPLEPTRVMATLQPTLFTSP